MIAHVPLLAHGDARRVLIIGAGDGGVLRRVLQHRGVKRAVMVEIDGEVVRLARTHLPAIGGGAWDDPRAEVIIGDGVAYVATEPDASVDVIIVDSTDPVGVGEVLFSEAFYAQCARVLSPAGIIVTQCGVPFMQGEELARSTARRRRSFAHVSAYVCAVPTYVGGLMTLGFAAKRAAPSSLVVEEVERRAERAGVLGTTRYWSPAIHVASFTLPPYVAEALAE